MPLKINPLEVNTNPEFQHFLFTFLHAEMKKQNFIWHENEEYPLEGDSKEGVSFQLTYGILRRERGAGKNTKPPKSGFRFEVFSTSDPLLGEGAYAKVRRSLGTLVLSDDRLLLSEKTNKQRIIKFFKSGVSLKCNECFVQLEHLHAKPTVFFNTPSFPHNRAQVMRLLPGITLKQFLYAKKNDPQKTLSPVHRLKIAKAILIAYQEQVGAYGLVHRDINSTNILIHEVRTPGHAESEEVIYYIDYDLATSLTEHSFSSESPTQSSEVESSSPILPPLVSPNTPSAALIPILPLESSNVQQHIKRSERLMPVQFFQLPKGTPGYIPLEGYQFPQGINPSYDYFALAQVISRIFCVPSECLNKVDYLKCKEIAQNVSFIEKIPVELGLQTDCKKKLEAHLTQMAAATATQRPSLHQSIKVITALLSQLETNALPSPMA